ncbi:hypothetical protein QJS10_CPB17g01320 [Acorus calamus]|uniref:Uncharacterized protein n=1 Tax=Acorus calamus TaxID=4465 RepID=A0AAV9CXP7_ACOCL|nr:hypothetical protein QJS10_CPB17g01320 [Acorus calamus]
MTISLILWLSASYSPTGGVSLLDEEAELLGHLINDGGGGGEEAAVADWGEEGEERRLLKMEATELSGHLINDGGGGGEEATVDGVTADGGGGGGAEVVEDGGDGKTLQGGLGEAGPLEEQIEGVCRGR